LPPFAGGGFAGAAEAETAAPHPAQKRSVGSSADPH
jgi:hypothetical protein